MRIIGRVTEAPVDGKQYARKDGSWAEVVGGGGGGTSYIDGRVSTYADLPSASLNDDKVYIVEIPTGVPFVNRKKAGLYYSNGTTWEFMPSSVQADYVLYNNTVSGIVGTDLQTAVDTLASQDKRGDGPEYFHVNQQQKSLVDGINSAISASTFSPITVTDNGNGTVTTGSVIMLLKESTALNAKAQGVNVGGIGQIALDIGKKYFLVGDWNNGSPIQRIEPVTTPTVNNYTVVLIGILTRGVGGDIYYTDCGLTQVDAVTKILRRIDDSSGLIIKTSGGLVSSSAGRYIQITSGRYYIANNIQHTVAFNSSLTDRFNTLYGDSIAGFTELNNVAQLNNTQYWNPATNALTNLSAGRYSVRWIFQLLDSPNEVYQWIETSQYNSLATARESLLTTDLPIQLQQYLNVSVLIAKVIVRQGQPDVIEVINIVNPQQQSVSTSNHNELTNLQGGVAGEYYHLTSADVLKLNGIEDGANLYVHPEFHPATIITQTADYRFVSDGEKTTWNGKWTYDESVIRAVKVDNAGNADTVNNLSVLTAVPLGALFTDTTYTASDFDIKDLSDSTLLRNSWSAKWTYDENVIKAVKVDNAVNSDTVGGFTVGVNVPSDAVFYYVASDFDIKDLLDSLGLRNSWSAKVEEAPLDNKTYGRKEGMWVEVTGGGSSSAIDVSYDNTTSGLTSNNVQEAIDELAVLLDGVETLLAEI
jgi:hypothetical protein